MRVTALRPIMDIWLVFAAAFLLDCTGAKPVGFAQPEAEVAFGKIFGQRVSVQNSDVACDAFLGIPFAQKPERFSDPEPWTESYGASGWNATRYGQYCPQLYNNGVGGSEDCLFLNLWRPVSGPPAAQTSLPVMAWIHGGSFVSGSGGDDTMANVYDGCSLAAKHGVIVATLNYRLGALGFATFQTSEGIISANFGLKDQRQAFQWLRSHVESFGGDGSKLTIFGESSGAMSVWHHVVSPKSDGLFRAGIAESGYPEAKGGDYAVQRTTRFASAAGCQGPALFKCLKSKSVEQLLHADEGGSDFSSEGWFPAVDGIELTDYPANLLARNLTKAVPMLSGSNTNEGNLFIWPPYPHGMNQTAYEGFIKRAFQHGDPAQAMNDSQLAFVFREYAAPKGVVDFRGQASRIVTDVMICRNSLAAASLSGRAPTYLYHFNQISSCPQLREVPGVYHSEELPYVFDTPWSYSCNFTGADAVLANRMGAMWTRFAKHLAPSESADHFPAVRPESIVDLKLQGTDDKVEERYRGPYCEFWQQHGNWGAMHQAKTTDATSEEVSPHPLLII
eukprot:TRINITY_DN40074_c0_g1_i1.p1 TRINITY_DN40074_c0_g1~~TRINITY_DN40074_c0_g1_i1.p1  ORF type:complete len:562 (+),score=60.78 TRINITY_DN40074_c0_g1_i1:65-1750(+)